MEIIRCMIFSLCYLSYQAVQAQIQTHNPKDSLHHCLRPSVTIDTNYIVQEEQRLLLEWFLGQRSSNININYRVAGQYYQIVWRPNLNGIHGLRMAYRSLSLGLAFKLPISQFAQRNFGNTRHTDFSFNFNKPRFSLKGFWLSYAGHYDAASSRYMPSAYEYYRQADLKQHIINLRAIYLISPEKYSYRAAWLYTERQRQSAGSILLTANTGANLSRTDSSLIPHPLHDSFGEWAALKRMQHYMMGVGGGYAHTFVYRYFQFSMLLSIGLNLQPTVYQLEGHAPDSHIRLSPYADTNVGFAYNHPSWLIAWQLHLINDGYRLSQELYGNTLRSWFEIKVGWRPMAPHFVRQSEDWLYHRLQNIGKGLKQLQLFKKKQKMTVA